MNNLLIVDYNGTIIPNDPDIRPYSIIMESLFGNSLAKEFKSPNKSRELLNMKNFSKEQFKGFFKNFESSEIYSKFQGLNNPKIFEVLNKSNNLPNDNIGNFVFDEFIYPLMALYNVYIANVKPFSDFSVFFKKIPNNCCFVVNSDSPHICILTELNEYAKLEEYSFLKKLLEEERIYGCMEESKKTDNERIQYIIGNLAAKGIISQNPEKIKFIGDGESDFQNFTSLPEYMNNKASMIFSKQNHLIIIETIKKELEENNFKEEKLTILAKKLSKIDEKIRTFESREKNRIVKIVNSLSSITFDRY